MKKKLLSLVLSAIMILTLLPFSAFAVTGSTVAADGTYSGSGSNVGTITVTVSGGKITNVTCSKATKAKYQTLVNTWLSAVKGKTASCSTIDSVSAATTGKYGSGLKSGTLAALKTAPAAASGSTDSGSGSSGSSSSGSSSGSTASTSEAVEDGIYSGEGSSVGTITVTVSGGTITNLTCSKATKSSYQTLVNNWLSKIKGKTASYATIDAITAATEGKYGTGLKNGTLAALSTASSAAPVAEEDNSEIGQGVGTKSGTKYTGTGTIDSEYVTLDVYVSSGKITGLFIAAEEGTWLNLLTAEQDKYIGTAANSATVDAITSSTTLGFRDTLRAAVSDALKSISGSSSSVTVGYKADGWDKEYSYKTLSSKQYYYRYQGSYYPITPIYDKKQSKDKPYAAYITVDGTRYYLDKADKKTGKLPTKWEGAKSATKKIYESAKADDDAEDQMREPQLYTKS